MTQIILPVSKLDNSSEHRAANILRGEGFAVSSANETNTENALHVHIVNSLTNRRGTDQSLSLWFAKAARLAQEEGRLDKNTSLYITFSGPEIRREHSRLDDKSFAKDQLYTNEFHDPSALMKNPHAVFVTGAEPQSDTRPTDIDADIRTPHIRSVIDFTNRRDIFTILSCRAAHIGLTDLAGKNGPDAIERLPQKLKSVVNASLNSPVHPIVSGIGEDLKMPISRWCGLREDVVDQLAHNRQVEKISYSPEAGTVIAARGNTFFISGHIESSKEGIEGEDKRDKERQTPGVYPTRNIEHSGIAETQGLRIASNFVALAAARRAVTAPKAAETTKNFSSAIPALEIGA